MDSTKIVRNIRLGIKDLMLHKLRSFLTALGMVFGVGSVIAMLAVGEGASKQALEQIHKLGSNNIIINSMKPVEQATYDKEAARLSMYGLLYEDEIRIRESLDTVKRTVPARMMRKDARLGERNMELRLVCTTPGWFELVKRRLVAGRVIAQRDMIKSAPVCVLTEHGARRLLATQHSIGENIKIGGVFYEVIGIIISEVGGTSIQVPDQEIDAYIPITVSIERYGEATYDHTSGSRSMELVELHAILVEVESLEQVEPSAAAIRAMLKRFHKKEDYKVSVPLTLLNQAKETKRTFNIVLGSIAGISLLVGGIGIMNIMLASVTERTREIGIRRAIGAKKRQIVLQFLTETLVLSLAGGLIGTLFGIGIPKIITSLSGMPTVIPGYGILLSLGISISIGIIFGIYPAMRAADLDPIEALRHE